MRDNDSQYGIEQAVLGNILVAPTEGLMALEALEEKDFVDSRHRTIFSILKEIYNEFRANGSKDFTLELIYVDEKLKQHKALSKAGGFAYLNELLELATTNIRVEDYTKLMLDNTLVREFISTISEMKRRYEEEPVDNSVFLGEAEEAILKITRKRHVADFINIEDAINKTLSFYSSADNSFSTGFSELDRLIEGFQPGNLTILAARPSVGKTAMAISFAERVSRRGKKAVGIFSLEMSAEQIVGRLLNDLTMLPTKRIKEVLVAKESDSTAFSADRVALKEGIALLRSHQIYIDDSSGNKISDIQAKARKLKASCPNLGLIIIDYIGLITSSSKNNNSNRQQEVAEISRSLKGLARDLQVPIIALSQLSRLIDNRPGHKPVLSDLRESGAIEQDADQVFFLYRPDYYQDDKKGQDEAPVFEEDETNKGVENISHVSLIIAKNRNGPLGVIEFLFDKAACHFEAIDSGAPSEDI